MGHLCRSHPGQFFLIFVLFTVNFIYFMSKWSVGIGFIGPQLLDFLFWVGWLVAYLLLTSVELDNEQGIRLYVSESTCFVCVIRIWKKKFCQNQMRTWKRNKLNLILDKFVFTSIDMLYCLNSALERVGNYLKWLLFCNERLGLKLSNLLYHNVLY